VQEAILESECIDLVTYPTAFFSFWYHMLGGDMGILHVDVLHDGAWDLDVMPPINGNQGNAWQTRRISLVPYGGQNIQIRLRAVTGVSFESDIAVDDLLVEFVAAPVANFATPAALLCQDSALVFSDSSSGDAITYAWDFGQGAVPTTATTPGPHQVLWSTPGIKQVALVVSNEVGKDTMLQTIMVENAPMAMFTSTQIAPDSFAFDNSSSPNATAYLWDFGDGSTSTDSSVSHFYGSDGDYTVTLVVSNACGVDSFTQDVNVTTVSLGQGLTGLRLGVAPNPNGGTFEVSLQGEVVGDIDLALLDLRGRALYQRSVAFRGGSHREAVSVSHLAEGVYLLRVRLAGQTSYLRVMVK
jgi:PKD repeat protein